jgi:hypothetical protein
MPNLFQEAKNTKDIYQRRIKECKKSIDLKYRWNQIKSNILYLSSRGLDTLIIRRPINNDITDKIILRLEKDGFNLDIEYSLHCNKSKLEKEINSIKIKW